MNFAEKAFRQTIRRLVLIQFGLVVGVAVVLYGFFDKTSEFSITLIYGGFVSIIVSILRAWRLKVATEETDSGLENNPNTLSGETGSLPKTEFNTSLESKNKATSSMGGVNALELYKGFALGYIVAIALLALGLGGLKLDPAAVIIGFVVAQLGHFFVRPPRPGAGR